VIDHSFSMSFSVVAFHPLSNGSELSLIVSILASFCVWTKSLICKDAATRDSTVQSEVRRISKFPVSRPDDVSSRPDARQSSIFRPDDVSSRPDAR